jgi:hypothetical protein
MASEGRAVTACPKRARDRSKYVDRKHNVCGMKAGKSKIKNSSGSVQ